MTTHIVQFSSGAGSFAAALRVAERHGADDLVLLFADVKTEHPDNYRFLHEAAAVIGVQPTIIAEGRTPQQVFEDEHFLGNSRVPICSLRLKIEPSRAWMEAHHAPADTILYAGIDWSEEHRKTEINRGWAPYGVEYPLCEPPYLEKDEIQALPRRYGIEPPAMYAQGFVHANCGGACVRGGQAHWKTLYEANPDLFADWEAFEQRFRDRFGDHSILREQRYGVRRPLPLSVLRRRIEAGAAQGELFAIDEFDVGGCGCMTMFAEPDEIGRAA